MGKRRIGGLKIILLKIHQTQQSEFISLCDSELIGKIFEGEETCLEVRKSFYDGHKLDEQEFEKNLKRASSLNIVGEESIKFVLKKKLISNKDIKKIQNIPFAILVIFT